MTEQKAIEWQKAFKRTYKSTPAEVDEVCDMAISALEKQIPKKPEHIIKKYGKHKWRRKENGEIDDFVWDFGYHCGVACEICGKAVCVCCNPDYDKLEDCEEEYWICPSCGKKMYSKSHTYCDCGQKLDWSDTE